MTRTPSTPGARQAKAEIPSDEQRVKAYFTKVVDEGYFGGAQFDVRCMDCERVKGDGHREDCTIGEAEAILELPASLPAEGPGFDGKTMERDSQRIADTIRRGAHFQDWRLASLAANQGHRGLMVTTAGDFVVYSSWQDLAAQDAIRAKPVVALPAEGVALPELRTKFLDYDARPEPKTELYCCKCQRDLDPNKARRYAFVNNEACIVHPEDVRIVDPESGSWLPMGPECANRVGLEWTLDAIPSRYRANFLWPHEDGSLEEAGYEFANGRTEEYVKEWWGNLLERVALSESAALRKQLEESSELLREANRGVVRRSDYEEMRLRAETAEAKLKENV